MPINDITSNLNLKRRKDNAMAVDIEIRSKGLLKKELSIHDVIFDNMGFGIMDENYRLDENKTGDYTVVYNRNSICRGCEISLKKGLVELRLPLPTSEADIVFFYDYIEKICHKMNVKNYVRNGEKATFDKKNEYIKDDISTSEMALKEIETKIDQGDYTCMYIFGVLNPIALGKDEMIKIQGDTNKFGEFMNSLQSMDVYYASAHLYKRSNNTIFAVYTLTESVESVMPYVPKILMLNESIQVNDWNVAFVIDKELEGKISYNDFINNVDKTNIYDSEHFILSLDKAKMRELLNQYKVEL